MGPRHAHSSSEREAFVPAKFVVKKGPTGKFRFSLVSTNGQVVASSQAYETKRAAMGRNRLRAEARRRRDTRRHHGRSASAPAKPAARAAAKKPAAKKPAAKPPPTRKPAAKKQPPRKARLPKKVGAPTVESWGGGGHQAPIPVSGDPTAPHEQPRRGLRADLNGDDTRELLALGPGGDLPGAAGRLAP